MSSALSGTASSGPAFSGTAFSGTSAVVSGASSGIGRAIAVGLAESGLSRLIVHFRQNARGAQETAELAQSHGCETTTLAGDLSVSTDRQRLCSEAFARLGVVHTWIHNAGADVLTGDAADESFEQKLDRLWQVDVRGTMLLARQVATEMMERPTPLPPSMVFIGWDQACDGMEGDAGMMFGSTKASIMAFASSLAQTLAPRIRVNTIAPGWIQTSWGAETSGYWDRRAKQQSLMNRWGTPQDVARAAVYLANPQNSFLTGQTIAVNGGWNRRGEERVNDQS
ncbi:MAG: SDR family NAD(P)-dependent oxidoreductase [Rubripirellula sp.]|nr:SDR family NAD(P)-dependent oxidoreductase [Rubripirellula sp.]